MTDAVLDASVVLKWFRRDGERHWQQARSIRSSFEAGALHAIAPALLFIEILNVAGRRWQLAPAQLELIADALPNLGFELVEVELPAVARWTARGLTAYDAVYVAVAEQVGTHLITDDAEVMRTAPDLTRSLETVGDRPH